MKRFLLPPLALVALLACSKPVEQPHRRPAHEPELVVPPAEDITAETANLLNIARGATVVSRTAELTLKASAAQAIDGDSDSAWISPPMDTRQTLVFALPARTRIEQVGIQSTSPGHEVKAARFEVSTDGSTFRPLYDAKFDANRQVQLVAVEPAEANYVRVTTTDAPGRFARLNGVHVRGGLLDKPVRASIAGCWSINGFDARFLEEGARYTGTIAEHGVVGLDGGTEGMLYRFAWTRGGETGVAAITLSGDGRHLTGLQWYEEPEPKTFATSWFGERKDCAGGAMDRVDVAGAFARKSKVFPLYSRTPDQVLTLLQQTPQRLRIVAHEYRHQSAQENRRRAQAELDQLREALQKRGADLSRLEFVASGSDRRRALMHSEVKRALNSVVEIERP